MSFDFDDWGSWGIGDFYKGNDAELRSAIESGKCFDTGWHGFKKELESFRVRRDNEGIMVEVLAYMDSAFEDTGLILDGITDEEAELLTDDMIEEIREYLYADTEFSDEAYDYEKLPATATFEDIMKSAKDLMNTCHDRLHDSFLSCAGTTLYVLYGCPSDVTFIEERLKNLE